MDGSILDWLAGLDWLIDALPIIMIITLACLLLSGYPVAFVLAGTGVLFALVGWVLGEFPLVAFFNVPLRIWGSLNGSLIYPAVPMLLFMGVALEKSGVARELLECLQRLLRWVPGNLAVSITVVGIILAPAAGLVGASVATLALIGLPTMLEQGYRNSIATGAVAAAGTLGIILPPGVMLFFLADFFRVQIAGMFVSTLIPAFAMAAMFIIYYVLAHLGKLGANVKKVGPWQGPWREFALYLLRGLILPVALVFFVLASIIAGWATPTQSAAVGAIGGVALLAIKGRLTLVIFHDTLLTTAMTCAMIFFIIVAATIFSYPFNFYSGPDLIRDFLADLGLGHWGMLLVILGITFVLGFFIDWIEVFVVALPIFTTRAQRPRLQRSRRFNGAGQALDSGLVRVGSTDVVFDATLRLLVVLRQRGRAAIRAHWRSLSGRCAHGPTATHDDWHRASMARCRGGPSEVGAHSIALCGPPSRHRRKH